MESDSIKVNSYIMIGILILVCQLVRILINAKIKSNSYFMFYMKVHLSNLQIEISINTLHFCNTSWIRLSIDLLKINHSLAVCLWLKAKIEMERNNSSYQQSFHLILISALQGLHHKPRTFKIFNVSSNLSKFNRNQDH